MPVLAFGPKITKSGLARDVDGAVCVANHGRIHLWEQTPQQFTASSLLSCCHLVLSTQESRSLRRVERKLKLLSSNYPSGAEG